MSRALHKLSAAKVAALVKDQAKNQGRHGDGGGLYLQIDGGSAAWLFRYIRDGRERNVGLGPARDVTLAQARDKAQGYRTVLARGDDPQTEYIGSRPAVTFAEAATQFLASYRRGLKNEKHSTQVGTRLLYAFPKLGSMPVSRITVNHVLAVLEPIWHETPETASRTRGLIQKVLDYAKVRGWRAGENPAAWKGNLEHALPAPGKLREV